MQGKENSFQKGTPKLRYKILRINGKILNPRTWPEIKNLWSETGHNTGSRNSLTWMARDLYLVRTSQTYFFPSHSFVISNFNTFTLLSNLNSSWNPGSHIIFPSGLERCMGMLHLSITLSRLLKPFSFLCRLEYQQYWTATCLCSSWSLLVYNKRPCLCRQVDRAVKSLHQMPDLLHDQLPSLSTRLYKHLNGSIMHSHKVFYIETEEHRGW